MRRPLVALFRAERQLREAIVICKKVEGGGLMGGGYAEIAGTIETSIPKSRQKLTF